MRTIHFRLIFIFIPFLSSNIWSDVILLKNGKSIEGKYIESNDEWLVIDNFEKLIRLQTNQVQSMDVGFSGLPICYKLKDNEEKNCKGLMHFLSKDKMVVAHGSGFMEALEIPIDEVENFSIQLNTKKDQLSRYIRRGIVLKITLSNKKILLGKYLKNKENQLIFQVNKETIQVFENQIQIVEYESGFQILDDRKYLQYLVPGISQWQSESKTKGTLLLGITTLSILGIGYEYNQAMNASNREITYIPLNNQLIGTNAFSENSKFEGHIQNVNILSGILVICYLYNAYDLHQNPNDSYGKLENLSTNQLIFQLNYNFPDRFLAMHRQSNDLMSFQFLF